MPKVDVHIVSRETEPWIDECLKSLCNEPVEVHMVTHIDGDTATARENGFSLGSCEYVSFVDPDDMVIPGIFAKCIDVLENNKDLSGVYTDEYLIDANKKVIMPGWSVNPDPFIPFGYNAELMQGIHHLRVLRRNAVEKCIPLKTKRIPEPVLMSELKNIGPLHHLREYGYLWRIYPGQTWGTYTDNEKNEALEIIKTINTN